MDTASIASSAYNPLTSPSANSQLNANAAPPPPPNQATASTQAATQNPPPPPQDSSSSQQGAGGGSPRANPSNLGNLLDVSA